MANINETIASMLAASRPQQAPPQTRPAVVASGPLKSKEVSVQAGIDIGAIMHLIGVGPEAEAKRNRMIESMQSAYMQRSEQIGEINAKKEVFDNPALQVALKKGYNEGNINVGKDEVSPGEFKYYPKRLILPQAAQEAATYGKLSPEMQQKYMRPQPTPAGVMSGATVNEKERKDYLAAQSYLTRVAAAAGGGGGEPENKALAAEMKSYNDFVAQNKKQKDLAVDDPTANYMANTALADRTLLHVSTIQQATGSTEGALGGVQVVGNSFDREMTRPMDNSKDTMRQRQQLMTTYANLLGNVGMYSGDGPVDVGELARLMDWMISLYGEQYARDNFTARLQPLSEKKGMSVDDAVDAIYSLTRWAALKGSEEIDKRSVVNDKQWYDKIRPVGVWADFLGVEGYKDIRPIGSWVDFFKGLRTKKEAVANDSKPTKSTPNIKTPPGKKRTFTDEEKKRLMREIGM